MKKLIKGSIFGHLFKKTEIPKINPLEISIEQLNKAWGKASLMIIKDWTEKEVSDQGKITGNPGRRAKARGCS